MAIYMHLMKYSILRSECSAIRNSAAIILTFYPKSNKNQHLRHSQHPRSDINSKYLYYFICTYKVDIISPASYLPDTGAASIKTFILFRGNFPVPFEGQKGTSGKGEWRAGKRTETIFFYSCWCKWRNLQTPGNPARI